MAPNVRLIYLYRDAANYKRLNTVVFSNDAQIHISEIEETIRRNLIDGFWFVADHWNLPNQFFTEYAYDVELDHDWHEYSGLENTFEIPNRIEDISEFLCKITATKKAVPTEQPLSNFIKTLAPNPLVI